MLIGAAREADYPEVARIQAAAPEAAQWPLGDYSGFQVLVAWEGETALGFCAWRQTATDEAEMLNLAVSPAWRKRGAGRALVAELRRMAAGTIFLEVAEANTPARALYRKTGWVEVSQRKDYYGPGQNAIVMKNSSCYSPE